MNNMRSSVFLGIVGSELSAIVFVRDYIQVQFDGPVLTAVTLPTVTAHGRSTGPAGPGYRDALCEQIGKAVRSGSVVEDDCIRIIFEDDSAIAISLKPSDYRAAEAATYRDEEGGLSVW